MHITRKFLSPEFCGSYAPLNLKISRNLILKQLVSATPLKLLNRISWNLVGSKDTICTFFCSFAYYQKFWSPKFCGSYAPLNLNFSEIYFWSSLSAQLLLKLLNRISWNLVGSKDTICSCAYYEEIFISWILWELCPFELKISRNLILKQLVSATPLKLLNRISWNLVGSKDTICTFFCSCAYYQEMLIP